MFKVIHKKEKIMEENKNNNKDKSALTIKICGFVLFGLGIAAIITVIVATFLLAFSYRAVPILCGACAITGAGAYLAFKPQQKK